VSNLKGARGLVVLVAGRKDGEVADGYTGLKRTIWGTVFLGLGLGGFFDGIVLHQILQWHHLVSQVEPVTTVAGLKINTLADGLFHGATYLFTLRGNPDGRAGRANRRRGGGSVVGARQPSAL
jgi:Predicted membrane protein (DUF2243)